MFMDVNKVLLPGVGLRYEFTNHDGERIGVVARRTGDFELVVYRSTDPDIGQPLVRLNSEEAGTLAEILGPSDDGTFRGPDQGSAWLIAAQVQVEPNASCADRPIGHTRARTRTGASIVAIVRGAEVIASPTPSEILRVDDVLVVIGTRDGGIAGVKMIMQS